MAGWLRIGSLFCRLPDGACPRVEGLGEGRSGIVLDGVSRVVVGSAADIAVSIDRAIANCETLALEEAVP